MTKLEQTRIEQWRAWSPEYEVSDLGQIRSTKRGKVLKQQRTYHGYLVVYLYKNGQKFRRYVHRVVLETFVGPCPNRHQGAHNNGLRDDCRLENLRWATAINNHADKQKHGTQRCGEQLPWARLTPERVRLLRNSTKSSGYFARVWNMNAESIRLARLRRTWKHVL